MTDPKEKIDPKPSESASTPQTNEALHFRAAIHPIVIYPFFQPQEKGALKLLYSKLQELTTRKSGPKYFEPVTIINKQTHYRALENTCSDLADSFSACQKVIFGRTVLTHCVDTCAMWQRGFEEALSQEDELNGGHDIYWLVPGDFDYTTEPGGEALEKLHLIPETIYNAGNGKCELCLGEIDVSPTSAKQLIDTYGTYGLLYNWFPREAKQIQKRTTKPRTEFFAIKSALLKTMLKARWYPYEQTIAILLRFLRSDPRASEKIAKITLGKIHDDPSTRKTFAQAMAQIERTELLLKYYWRELREEQAKATSRPFPANKYRKLIEKSAQICGAAMTIMQFELEQS